MSALLFKIVSPYTYINAVKGFHNHAKVNYMQKGKMMEPIVFVMCVIGVTGYSIEYACLGRYHIAHKKEKIALALKEYDENHKNDHAAH